MTAALLSAPLLFAATNLDDLIWLLFLFAGERRGVARGRVLLGRLLGMAVLVALSRLGALGTRLIPDRWVGLLGIVPILLGICFYVSGRRADGQGDETARPAAVGVLGAALMTFACGADNLSVYIPVFAGYSGAQMASVFAVFAGMTVLWHFAAVWLLRWPGLAEALARRQRIAVAIVFVLLGVLILAEAYLG